MMQNNDTQLISRILDGDVSGYAVLVDRYKDMAFTIAFRILGKREDCEEVIQDAFVKAFRNLSSFRQKAKFSTWLYRIVYNTAISRKRLKGFGFQSIEELPHVESGIEPDDDPEQDQGKMLERAMKKLPEEERTILTLFYLEESSVEEIHDITGLSKANVKIKLFRARKKLQEMVREPSLITYS
jgi:RNA polymerase sigma factor (sigma-70 family)